MPLCVMKVMRIWQSRQNGMVYDPEGIAPCLCVGNHSGVEPKIIEIEHYAYNQTYKKDCSFTITTRIDGANEHFITIDYEAEDSAGDEERVHRGRTKRVL